MTVLYLYIPGIVVITGRYGHERIAMFTRPWQHKYWSCESRERTHAHAWAGARLITRPSSTRRPLTAVQCSKQLILSISIHRCVCFMYYLLHLEFATTLQKGHPGAYDMYLIDKLKRAVATTNISYH